MAWTTDLVRLWEAHPGLVLPSRGSGPAGLLLLDFWML